ncbi:MAG TPA: tetratricopeptide repeat protein [Verrucomicrobiae bacterium]|nr:tetratricopeptide repeat protein [Verrucomicrobiae bacterium]
MAKEAQSDLRIIDEFDFEAFWAQHGKKIVIGILAVVAFGGVLLFRENQANQRLEQASASLAAARDPAALEAVARDFAGTSAALEALSRLADEQFRAGQYAEATATFNRILKEFSSQPLAESARLGLAAVQEGQGNYEAAKESYALIVESNPTGFTATAAKMGMARCSEALGQAKEARQLYEEVLVNTQGSLWRQEAYLRWTVLGREVPPSPATGTEAPSANPAASLPLGMAPAKNVQP